MNIKLLISIIFFIAFVNSFAKKKNDRAVIGTFNIEWLGDGIDDKKPRTEEDYKLIADYIKDLEPDILALQEIENQDALNKVLSHLKAYQGIVLNSGGFQNVGVIYHRDVKIKSYTEYSPLAVEFKKTRSGLILECKKNNFDWLMMIVHFKATSSFDRTKEMREFALETRRKQAEVLNNWIDSVLQNSKEKDLIVLGDFNDSPNNPYSNALEILKNNKKINIITDKLNSCQNPKWASIDNIILSKSAKKRCFQETLRMYNTKKIYSWKIAQKISDHCPVLVDFETLNADND